MSAPIAAAGWPSNMSPDNRKRFLVEQIEEFCHSKRVKDALTPEQLGDLSLGSKFHVYKNAIIRGSILHCRNRRADARMSLFNIIVFLTDNGHGSAICPWPSSASYCIDTATRSSRTWGRWRRTGRSSSTGRPG